MPAYPLVSDKGYDYKALLNEIGVDPNAVCSMLEKTNLLNILVRDVKSSWANIIKQEMIASGGDAAINMNCYACKVEKSDILLMGSLSVVGRFVRKMKKQPLCFTEFTQEIEKIISAYRKDDYKFCIADRVFDLDKEIVCIGILNITPDSFSDGGKFLDYDSAMKHAESLITGGADIIDVGGESTRPGSSRVSVEEEMERVIPVIESIRRNLKAITSIDSYKPQIIKEALKSGVNLVNDVSNGRAVSACAEEIKINNASALIMQNLSPDGISGSLGEKAVKDPLATFINFKDNIDKELSDKGIDSAKLMFDPGIGFGLSTGDISRMLKNISAITALKIPLCVGISRKSYLTRITQVIAKDADNVGNAVSMYLMTKGVKIFRTHDPEGLRTVQRLYKEIF